MSITKKLFDITKDGQNVYSYILTNIHGSSVEILDFGGIIRSIIVPDRTGKMTDVVIGFDTIDEYLTNHDYFGALIGRYCNRITNGEFQLNGETIKLNKNDNGRHTLHGGFNGFDQRIWEVKANETASSDELELSLFSPDGDENFPGNLNVKVTYTFDRNNNLLIEYCARSDKDTVVNFTNHTYFNLNGHDSGCVCSHTMQILSSRFTPCDNTCGVTGEIKDVDSTYFDFRSPRSLADGLNNISDSEDLTNGNGYDHNFIFDKHSGEYAGCLKLLGNKSGIKVSLSTDQPGIQIYTGNFIKDGMKGKGGASYVNRAAVCLETQHFPDSVNHPDWPTTVLKAGEEFKTVTGYLFTTV